MPRRLLLLAGLCGLALVCLSAGVRAAEDPEFLDPFDDEFDDFGDMAADDDIFQDDGGDGDVFVGDGDEGEEDDDDDDDDNDGRADAYGQARTASGVVEGDDDEEDDEDDEVEDAKDDVLVQPQASGPLLDEEDPSLLDEDEFVGIPDLSAGGKASKAKKKSKSRASSSAAASAGTGGGAGAGGVPSQGHPLAGEPPADYTYEMMALCMVGVYVLVFLTGKRANDSIAEAWFRALESLIAAQFAHPAAYGPSIDTGDSVLLKDSQSSYKFYSTGRRYCQGMLVTLDLKKRHDVLSTLMGLVDLDRTQDLMTVEIPMDDGVYPPLVFTVARQRDVKQMKALHKDLERFVRSSATREMGDQTYAILTDCPELTDQFLSELVVAVLSQNSDLFRSMHFSDSTKSSYSDSKSVLRFVFAIPKVAQMDRLVKLTEMALYFVDHTASRIQLKGSLLSRATELREKAQVEDKRASHAERQEKFLQKREEALKEDSEKSAALRKKLERKAAKKSQPKVKMLKS